MKGSFRAFIHLIKSSYKLNPSQYRWILLFAVCISICEIAILVSTLLLLYDLTESNTLATSAPLLSYVSSALKKLATDISIDSKYIPLFLLCLTLAATIGRTWMCRKNFELAAIVGSELCSLVYYKSLFSSYNAISRADNGKLVNNLAVHTNQLVNGGIVPILTSLLNLIKAAIFVYFLLVSFRNQTLVLLAPVIVVFICVASHTKKVLDRNSFDITRLQRLVLSIIANSFLDYKNVLLGLAREDYYGGYSKVNKTIRLKQAQSTFYSIAPRIFAEPLIVPIFICSFIYILSPLYGVSLAALATVLLILQRIMPLVQQVYGSFTLLRNNSSAIIELSNTLQSHSGSRDVVNYQQRLHRFYSEKKAPAFLKSIEIRNLSYCRESNPSNMVIKDCSLILQPGHQYLIKGVSGSGKTTLVDLIVGLIHPTSGSIKFKMSDSRFGEYYCSSADQALRRLEVAYCTQSPFIKNCTILENIIGSRKYYDKEWLDIVIETCQLHHLINELPEGLQSIVGENGRLLSGGQRQRLALASSIYNQPQFIVLDESTSALDLETQWKVANGIFKILKSSIVLIVSHSSEVEHICSDVISVSNGLVEVDRACRL